MTQVSIIKKEEDHVVVVTGQMNCMTERLKKLVHIHLVRPIHNHNEPVKILKISQANKIGVLLIFSCTKYITLNNVRYGIPII